MCTFSVVPPAMIPVIWSDIVWYLEKVVRVSSGELSLDSVYQSMIEGKCVTIIVIDGQQIIGINTVEIFTFNSGLKALYIPIIGGERIDEWGVEFFNICKDYAKQVGCTELRGLAARAGWMRKLASKDLKWKKCYEVIKYELD